MEIYTLFTISESTQNLLFQPFDSYEKAENSVNSNTEANIKLVGRDAVLYEKFGTKYDDLVKWKPWLVNNLFPFYEVEYGTVVRETKPFGVNKGEFDYTYRFIIKQTLNEK